MVRGLGVAWHDDRKFEDTEGDDEADVAKVVGGDDHKFKKRDDEVDRARTS